MLNLKNKDLVMFGLVIGIALFFIGAMISNVFPSSESNLIGYKLSSFIKMLGLGFVVSSMVVGGIIVKKIDKNLKILLLLLGLILLIVYTVGAQQLHWDVASSPESSDSFEEEAYEDRPTGYGVPGFEIISTIIAIAALLLIAKIKRIRR